MPRHARALLLGGAAAAALAALALRPVPVLEIANAARGRTACLKLPEGARFSVVAQHSMYDAPVTEEFAVAGDGRILLQAVASPSAAVREYLGLTAAGERQPVHRELPEIVFRVAAGPEQRLRVGAQERSFLDFGAHGDRLVLRAARRPALLASLAVPLPSPLTCAARAARRRAP